MPRRGPTIVVGFDFGTTFTGVAWTISLRPDDLHIVRNVDSLSSDGSLSYKPKTPTCISYKDDGQVLSWGNSVAKGAIAARLFKLLLLNEEDLPDHVKNSTFLQNARGLLDATPKSLVELIADYLRLIWQHTLENINNTSAQILNLCELDVVFTLPAIWPFYAQSRMREAIEIAGSLDAREVGKTSLRFVSEPESAALATMKDLSGSVKIEAGDHVIVCDCGGGTVDAITYEIVKSDPMIVRESVKGEGRLCGASFLDEAFSQFVTTAVSQNIPAEMGELVRDHVANLMTEKWELLIRSQFCNEDVSWIIPVRVADAANGNNSFNIEITRQQLLSVFQSVTLQITELVKDQIRQVKELHDKVPKYVVLVGGFGQSRYLFQHLRETVGSELDILQAQGELPAVCRGAVIKGLTKGQLCESLSVAVETRIARASYGTVMDIMPWTSDYDARDKQPCPVSGGFLAIEQAHWFLRIGDRIHDGKPYRFRFFQEIESPDETIDTQLIYSEEAEPPARAVDGPKKLCHISWSVASIYDALEVKTNSKGEDHRRVDYDLQMTVDGAAIDFAILHHGLEVASQNVNIGLGQSGASFRRRMY